MRVALIPMNPIVGDVAGNASRMRRLIDGARLGIGEVSGVPGNAPVDLIVFPELALSGYPPRDLVYQEGFLQAIQREASQIGGEHSAGVTIVFGAPLAVARSGPGSSDDSGPNAAPAAHPTRPPADSELHASGITNSLLAYRDGVLLARYDKRLLPTYDVFDEDRYFIPGSHAAVIEVAGFRVGLSICEDLWRGEDVGFASRYADRADPVQALIDAGAQVIVNPSASPFVLGKSQRHREILIRHATRHRVPVLAVNQLGGNDDLVFDGSTVAVDHSGHVMAAGSGFQEQTLVVDVPARRDGHAPAPGPAAHPAARPRGGADDDPLQLPDEERLYRALVLGVRDYLGKTGFASAVLGLSGGIDSAVTAVIAAAALGPEHVLGVALPSRYTSDGANIDALSLATNLGIRHEVIPIERGFEALLNSLAPAFCGRSPDVTEENLQSRLRGTILMALSNKFGRLLLTTGNKSELAVGYCTLYGDMNGGLAVLSDVTKQWVYRLARWINAHPARLSLPAPDARPPGAWPIPESSISKPPSAELRPNQTDLDSLPPYPVLDEVIERYVERRQSAARIAREMGYGAGSDGEAVVSRVVRLIDLSEYKRKQAAIGLKVTSVAFGSGRRFPIAQNWRG